MILERKEEERETHTDRDRDRETETERERHREKVNGPVWSKFNGEEIPGSGRSMHGYI